MCITILQSCLFLSLKRCTNYELLGSSDSTVKQHILLKACMKPCSRSQNSDHILLKYCSHCGEVKPRTSRAVRPHLQGSRNIIGSRILATTYRGFPSRVSFSFFDSQTSSHHSRHLLPDVWLTLSVSSLPPRSIHYYYYYYYYYYYCAFWALTTSWETYHPSITSESCLNACILRYLVILNVDLTSTRSQRSLLRFISISVV